MELMPVVWDVVVMYHLFVRTNRLTINKKEEKMSKHDDKQCKCKNCGTVAGSKCDKSGGRDKKNPEK